MKPDYSARRRGMPAMPIEERLKSNMKVNPVSGCWDENHFGIPFCSDFENAEDGE